MIFIYYKVSKYEVFKWNEGRIYIHLLQDLYACRRKEEYIFIRIMRHAVMYISQIQAFPPPPGTSSGI